MTRNTTVEGEIQVYIYRQPADQPAGSREKREQAKVHDARSERKRVRLQEVDESGNEDTAPPLESIGKQNGATASDSDLDFVSQSPVGPRSKLVSRWLVGLGLESTRGNSPSGPSMSRMRSSNNRSLMAWSESSRVSFSQTAHGRVFVLGACLRVGFKSVSGVSNG